MGQKSQIEWTDATWNIAVGCTKVDADCKNCYMYRDSLNGTRYEPKTVRKTKTVFDLPKKIKEPSKIFTCSLTDFFHPDCDSFRNEAWEIIRDCPQHTFQILTKRPERILAHLPAFWEKIQFRVWLGTSVGHQGAMHRVDDLVAPIGPGIKFLSLEPLHGAIELGLGRQMDFGHKLGGLLDWIIIGGESGHTQGKYAARPCKPEWIEDLIRQAREYGIPVFVKQLGSVLAREMKLKDPHGRDMSEWPQSLQVRQWPDA
jgi:protein gp37